MATKRLVKTVIPETILNRINFTLIRKLQERCLLEMLDLHKEERILDIGCGRGYFTPKIIDQCSAYMGIDYRIWRIRRLNDHRVSYVLCNGLSLPFRDNSFDKVLLSSVVQMVDKDVELMDEARRVLKVNGCAVLSVPVGYLLIKYLYSKKIPVLTRVFTWLLQLGRLPQDYDSFRLFLKNAFHEKSEYSLSTVLRLLNRCEFTVEKYEYSPKILGSILYEFNLLFCMLIGLNPFHPMYYWALYPLASIDNILWQGSKGIEVIIKAVPRVRRYGHESRGRREN